MRVIYHPQANREVVEAAYFYDEKRPGLGVDFLDELERVVAHIAKNPNQFAVERGDIRRAMLKRFPYRILFREIDDGIRVLAIRHHSRHPDSGLDRR